VQEAVAATNAAQKASLDRQVEEKRDRMAFAQREAAKRQAEEQQRAIEELSQLEGQRKGGRAPPMGKGAAPVHSVERALEDAFSRYEEYLHTRKEGLEMHSSFNREQRHLSEQAELLKAEEQRRRTAEMRTYLEKQMQTRATEREKSKLEERYSVSRLPITSLPTGSEVDAEEEAYVKMALKHALDGQVERNEASKTNERQQELQQEQQALSHVAREMQEVRFRAYSERKQMEESLRATWAKQQQLKVMEATLQKAEAA